MKPTRDLVLIEADKPKKQTDSGLYVVEDWKTLPMTGTVKEVGPKVSEVKVGDRVVFERYSALVLEGDMRMCKELNILAKLDA